MLVVDTDNSVFVDVDHTLILYEFDLFNVDHESIIYVNGAYYLPHKKHIEKLKQFKNREQTVVVWSQSGYKWARTIVEALKLEDYVDVVMAKPRWFIDDLPASEFMPEVQRIYIQPEKT